MKVDNRRNRIGRFGFVCPADFRRISTPELADREKSNIAGKKEPAVHARDHCRVLTLSRTRFGRQFVNEFLLRLRQRAQVARKGSWDSQTAKDSGVKTQIAEKAKSFACTTLRQSERFPTPADG